MKTILKSIVGFSIAYIVSLLFCAFLLPPLFALIERVTGAPLPYESALRLVIFSTWCFLMFFSLPWLTTHGDRRHWLLFTILLLALPPAVVVFFFDQNHRLFEEYSWIRYITAAALFATALQSYILGILYMKEGKGRRTLGIVWGVIASAFVYAGLDELLMIHETIGRFLRAKIHGGPLAGDLITIVYAIGAIVFLIFFFKTFFRAYRNRSTLFLSIFFLGAFTFFVSQIFDTVDVVIGGKLHSFTKLLSSNNSFFFQDPWSIFWVPHDFFNGFEEVLEYVAAVIFFTAALLAFLEKQSFAFTLEKTRTHSPLRSSLARIAISVLVISAFFSFTNGVTRYLDSSPLTDTTIAVARIAGPKESLRHTDDLFYHPSWGVVVGNEGGGTVLRVDESMHTSVVPDPTGIVHDTDSITASPDALYAADGAEGIMFSYTKENGWQKEWTRKDGLKHPEGFVINKGILYILDESDKKGSITKLEKGRKAEVWQPSHPLWKTPEGIDYDKTTNTLIVTDDSTGAVFRIKFGESIGLITKLENPEDIAILSDGRILVTDNGWGAIFMIDTDGSSKKLAQFKRAYRDLQGITVDSQNRIYVVTADGFDSVSFMPSFLFRIDGLL
ncbi:hypothetical protein HY621_02840 [Candidatus Uhrbacteria bacterium]|nr:hypothetical protein [Candidatus Uhrbacteria bacterium]